MGQLGKSYHIKKTVEQEVKVKNREPKMLVFFIYLGVMTPIYIQ